MSSVEARDGKRGRSVSDNNKKVCSFFKGTVVHAREEACILFLIDVEMLSGERLRHSSSATLEVCLCPVGWRKLL